MSSPSARGTEIRSMRDETQQREGIFSKYIAVSRDSISRTADDGIMLLPWNLFLDWLWDGRIL